MDKSFTLNLGAIFNVLYGTRGEPEIATPANNSAPFNAVIKGFFNEEILMDPSDPPVLTSVEIDLHDFLAQISTSDTGVISCAVAIDEDTENIVITFNQEGS